MTGETISCGYFKVNINKDKVCRLEISESDLRAPYFPMRDRNPQGNVFTKVADFMSRREPKVLHVVVGHGLPTYFMNAVRSVRAAAPNDPVLVIDNASPNPEFLTALKRLAEGDPKIDLVLRTTNELQHNSKVGGLYDAYKLAFEHAITRKFDFVHLIQGDFQVMWWNDELVRKACEIYETKSNCVNIHMLFLARDKQWSDELIMTANGLLKLKNYGITDTGLYHLGRWKERVMHFDSYERRHAERYLNDGLEVFCHPWPADAQIPWPAVIRNGRQRGKEVVTNKPFLLKPLSRGDIAKLKGNETRAWLDDMCIPWGWVCATPMWVYGLDSIDYWVLRYRDAKRNGISHFFPRLELRGVDRKERSVIFRRLEYRPRVLDLFVTAPAREIVRKLRRER